MAAGIECARIGSEAIPTNMENISRFYISTSRRLAPYPIFRLRSISPVLRRPYSSYYTGGFAHELPRSIYTRQGFPVDTGSNTARGFFSEARTQIVAHRELKQFGSYIRTSAVYRTHEIETEDQQISVQIIVMEYISGKTAKRRVDE